jgi:hypothetical protein
VTWWPLRRRHLPATPPPPAKRPGNGEVATARRAVAESQRRLERDRARVDEWTGEIQKLLGGRP